MNNKKPYKKLGIINTAKEINNELGQLLSFIDHILDVLMNPYW